MNSVVFDGDIDGNLDQHGMASDPSSQRKHMYAQIRKYNNSYSLDGGAHSLFLLHERLCGVIDSTLGIYVGAEPYSHR
jgi:hypothetical protein